MKKILTLAVAGAMLLTAQMGAAEADKVRVIGDGDIRWIDRDRSTLEDDIVDLADLFTDRDLDRDFLDDRNYDRNGNYIGHPVYRDGKFCPPGQAKKGRC